MQYLKMKDMSVVLIVRQFLVALIYKMQGVGDPDLFEISQVVEKSSKTGIFSNTRLLMIKDGYLYYFSKVPAQYKGHEPNLMATLKEYPKCSIEIRHIKKIRPQSPKSPTLIIEFNEKDMIDREDIRQSLSSKNFNPPKKEGSDLEEWKFSFSNFGKCRQWYFALETLKAHFEKHQDKYDRFTQYMANFDNELRKSLPRYSPSSHSSLIATSQLANSRALQNQPSLVPQNQPSRMPPADPVSRSNFPTVFGEPQFQRTNVNSLDSAPQNKFSDKYHSDKAGIFAIQQVEEQDEDLSVVSKVPEIRRDEQFKIQVFKEEVILKHHQEEVSKETNSLVNKAGPDSVREDRKEQELRASLQAMEQEREKQKMITEEVIAKAVSEARQQILKEERRRGEEKSDTLKKTLEEKQTIIRRMQEELQESKKVQLQLEDQVNSEAQKREQEERVRLRLQLQKKEEEEYRKLSQCIDNQPSIERQISKQANIKEESIQTEFQRDFMEVLQANNRSTENKISRYSYHSEFNRTETLNLQQIATSRITQVQEQEGLEHYQYFWQLGQLYKQNDTTYKVAKEMALAQFIRKATKQASLIVSQYIDENKPVKPIKLERHLFEIQIVCQRGQIIRTQGRNRLVYVNEEHQRLKRTFKIYNQLNEIILINLKKKPNYPLRVPFCCLIQYKGYTALAQFSPLKQTPSKNHNILKTLGPDIPAYNLRMHDFDAKDAECCLLTVATVYKATKQDETSVLRLPLKNYDLVELNRRRNISIEAQKLFEEAQSSGNNSQERTNLAKIISFCRQFKKVMKSHAPYVEYPEELDFFDQFLKNPKKFMEEEGQDVKITGILLYYCQKLLGISLKSRIGSEEPNYSVTPVVRKLSLLNLDISLFAQKMERLSLEGKYELAELALKYSKELEDDYSEVLMKQIHLNICKSHYAESLYRIELAYEMMTPHDPRRLKLIELKAQCEEAMGQQEDVLSTLKLLLEETEYMYNDKSKLVEVYFLIAGTLSRQQLNKQLVEVYRKIITESPSHRHRVVLEFSQGLLAQQADPHILLDFLQQESQQLGQAPQTQLLLGDIYFKCRNYQKAIAYFESAFETIITIRTNHPDLFSAYHRLIECSPSTTQKKLIHRQLVKYAANTKMSMDLTRRFNTIVAEILCEHLSREERERLMRVIEEKGGDSQRWIGSADEKVLQWTEMERVIAGAAKGDQFALKKLMEGVDYQKMTDRCFLLNNSELL